MQSGQLRRSTTVAEMEAGRGETLDLWPEVQVAGLGGEADGLGGAGPGERVEDMLALGTAALGGGNWADARDAYQRALAVGEDAATLEGLTYACWWLRDDAVTVDARRKAFRLYLDAGDSVSAARVAISLARDHILQGERSVANGWVGRAQRLLAEAGPLVESGWLSIVKAHLAL
jgi:hypothetical protein